MNRNAFEPGPRAEVDYLANEDGWTLVFVRELAHPPEQVWAALTDPAQLREWAPFTADRSLGAEGEATLTMIDDETEEELPAVVRRAERPRVLEYSWGDDLLRWDLSPTGSGRGSRSGTPSQIRTCCRRSRPAGTSASTSPSGCSTGARSARSSGRPRRISAGMSYATPTPRSSAAQAPRRRRQFTSWMVRSSRSRRRA